MNTPPDSLPVNEAECRHLSPDLFWIDPGPFSIVLYQIQCRDCGRRFFPAPLPGLAFVNFCKGE